MLVEQDWYVGHGSAHVQLIFDAPGLWRETCLPAIISKACPGWLLQLCHRRDPTQPDPTQTDGSEEKTADRDVFMRSCGGAWGAPGMAFGASRASLPSPGQRMFDYCSLSAECSRIFCLPVLTISCRSGLSNGL